MDGLQPSSKQGTEHEGNTRVLSGLSKGSAAQDLAKLVLVTDILANEQAHTNIHGYGRFHWSLFRIKQLLVNLVKLAPLISFRGLYSEHLGHHILASMSIG